MRARVGLNLSWEDIGFFGNAIAIASRQWRTAAKEVRDEYALGPHGPWIIGLIASHQVVYPSDLTKVLRCGRSLISAELNKLNEAGLINCRKSEEDGRQIELSVTPLGTEANERIAESLTSMLEERLVHYGREDILYCARLLRDLAGSSIEIS
jgi:DNA-binding MarR family transcriptional regulator